MIIVLSGFNGIESLVKELYSHFDPDITFTPAKGKSFHEDEIDFDQLMALEEVAYAYPVIEEITMVKHEEQYVFATMKGVGDVFFSRVCSKNQFLTEKAVLLITIPPL